MEIIVLSSDSHWFINDEFLVLTITDLYLDKPT